MKKIFSLMLVFTLIFSSLIQVSAQAVDYNLEMDLSVQSDEMLSGENNSLMVKLKSTGAKTEFHNAQVELKFTPSANVILDKENLDKVIEGKFDSYTIDPDKGTLVFNAKILKSGLYYELPIIFKTENGLVADKSEITFSVSFISDELNKSAEDKKVTVSANKPAKINKEYLGMNKDGPISQGLFYGADSFWKTKASIDKKTSGQLFIKEGSKIIISETYSDKLVYKGMSQGPEPISHDEAERTLVWEFDAPSIAEQREASGNLWFEEFVVKYNTIDVAKDDQELDMVNVEAKLLFTDISGNQSTHEIKTETKLFPIGGDVPFLDGTWYMPGHWGPTDANGGHGYAGYDDMNQHIVSYPWGEISFAHQMTAMNNGRIKGYRVYLFDYYISDYLELDELRTPTEWRYRPDNKNTPSPPGSLPLDEFPEYSIYFLSEKLELSIEGNNTTPASAVIAEFKVGEDFQHGDTITKEDILAKAGLPTNSDIHIAQVRYDITKPVAGMIVENGIKGANMMKYTFSISDNWRDGKDSSGKTELKNELAIYNETKEPKNTIIAELFDMRQETLDKGYVVSNNIWISPMYQVRFADGSTRDDGLASKWWVVNDPRWAYVQETPQTYRPTVGNTIELLNHKNNSIIPGENRLKVTVQNHDVSIGEIMPSGINPGGIESFIMVPKSLDLDLNNANAYDDDGNKVKIDLEKLDMDYGSYQFYSIKWKPGSSDFIKPGMTLNIEIDTDVQDDYQDLTMYVFSDFPNNNDFNIIETASPKITDTSIVADTHNLAGHGQEYQVIKAGNAYHLISDYYVKTKKMVKGDLDSDYSLAGKASVDGTVEYKMEITNREGRSLTNFVFLDVLPALSDLGITDGVERGSEFALTLSGPVEVGDKFTVKYSKAENPKRDILNEQLVSDGFDPIENPAGSQDPNWILENEVEDWGEIKSFVIVLNKGELLADNELTEIKFSAELDQDSKDFINKNSGEVYNAWNSFALTVNGKPTIEPSQVKVSVIDLEFIDIKVDKLWVGGEDRPDVELQLKRQIEGAESWENVSAVTLNASKGWSYVWDDMDKTDSDGNTYIYSLVEKNVENYKSDVEGSAEEGFTVTNTYIEKPTPKPTEKPTDPSTPVTTDLAKTGDGSNILIWIALVFVSLAVLSLRLGWYLRKKKS